MKKIYQRGFWGLLASILLFLGATNLFAVDNNISGLAPTQNTDGSALTDLASIRIYKSVITTPSPNCAAAGTVYSVLVTKPFTTPGVQFTHLDANQTTNGRYCYKATAIDTSGNESVFSNTAFKDVDLLFPGAPSGLTVN
jgi:hypothetical protein